MEKEYCQVILNQLVDIDSDETKEEVFQLSYEECVEIFSVYRIAKKGNECFASAMKKAEQIFNSLPVTDY